MKKIFFFLLKKYSKTESQRILVYKELYKSVCENYNEQTGVGNIYNSNIEFIMSFDYIRNICLSDKKIEINSLKSMLVESINESIIQIKNEPSK